MRRAATAACALIGATVLASAQEAPRVTTEVQPRFGVAPRLKSFPQNTAKAALQSVIDAVERNEYAYLFAHLMDPQFVDARVADRGKQLEPGIEVELAKLREFQKKNPGGIPPESRVPDDPTLFRAMAAREARTRAFRLLVRDVQDKLTEDPTVLKDLRRFLREGTVAEQPGGARVGLADLKDRAVFLKQLDGRWFVENRQADEKAAPGKEPLEKKGPEDKKP
jgi:hypothetical protein